MRTCSDGLVPPSGGASAGAAGMLAAMPEGHTVLRAARQQNRHFAGRRVAVTSPQGRFAAGAARVDGAVLETVETYGKHLFQHWDNDAVLHVHLGLYGRLRLQRTRQAEPPRGLIRMRMSADDRDVVTAPDAACRRTPLVTCGRGSAAC